MWSPEGHEDMSPFPLQWRHMNVLMSQITGHSTVCLTAYADPHERNIRARITGHTWGEFTGDAEKASKWWRHYLEDTNTSRPGQNGRHFANDTFK